MTLIAGNLVNQRGYSLVIIMIAVLIMGILAEAAVGIEARQRQVSKEAELLFRGMAYQRAILSYYQAGQQQQRGYPRQLEDLLYDPDYAHLRHLRALYDDPMINQPWRIIRTENGGISGIASSSLEKPVKQAFFPEPLDHFSNATNYSEWIFAAQ